MSNGNSGASTQLAAAPAARTVQARDDSVLVLGNDLVLAARPASAVQVAHAALRAGFDAVVPASWGDELVAAHGARLLADRPTQSAVFCACPEVAHRALASGAELAPYLLSLVPPPVALAQYLRALYAPRGVRLTYAGRCPGAQSDAYDARVSPDEMLRLLLDREIDPASQPDAFDAIVPPDRRRHASLPGGLPAVSALRAAACPHSVVELEAEDVATELAQHLLDGHPKLVDAAVRLGCACAGAASGCARDPRVELMAMEPPRSPSVVVALPEWMRLQLTLPVPLATRAASDLVVALDRHIRDVPPPAPPPPDPSQAAGTDRPVERIVDPAADMAQPARRRSPPGGIPVVRPAAGLGPSARGSDGRVLPRAYVARRRSAPRPMVEPPSTPDDAPQPASRHD